VASAQPPQTHVPSQPLQPLQPLNPTGSVPTTWPYENPHAMSHRGGEANMSSCEAAVHATALVPTLSNATTHDADSQMEEGELNDPNFDDLYEPEESSQLQPAPRVATLAPSMAAMEASSGGVAKTPLSSFVSHNGTTHAIPNVTVSQLPGQLPLPQWPTIQVNNNNNNNNNNSGSGSIHDNTSSNMLKTDQALSTRSNSYSPRLSPALGRHKMTAVERKLLRKSALVSGLFVSGSSSDVTHRYEKG